MGFSLKLRLFCKIYMRSNGLDLFAGRSDGSSFLDDVARPGGKNRPAFRSLEDMYQSTWKVIFCRVLRTKQTVLASTSITFKLARPNFNLPTKCAAPKLPGNLSLLKYMTPPKKLDRWSCFPLELKLFWKTLQNDFFLIVMNGLKMWNRWS